jgi:hypothetical protein
VFVAETYPRVGCSGHGYKGLILRDGTQRVLYDDGDALTQTLPIRINDKDVAIATRYLSAEDPDDPFGCVYPDSRVLVFVPPPPAQLAAEVSESIEELVDSGTVSSGDGTALSSQLDAAINSLDNGQTTPAINVLGAFVNKTEALVKSGRLSAAEGEALTAAAQQVIAKAR